MGPIEESISRCEFDGRLGMNFEWLIVGGGIHGVHIAARLLGDGGVSPDRLAILDPGERLLERWLKCTETTGMQYLRSPSVHHLDLESSSLRRFAGDLKAKALGQFVTPNARPALSLFNAHCETVIDTFCLNDRHLRARVVECLPQKEGVDVKLSTGDVIRTVNVLFAIGSSEQPYYPEWAPMTDVRIQHVFAKGFTDLPSNKQSIAVVGGGISAAQVALRLSKEGHEVHFVSRHPLREHQYDSEPAWLGPKNMTGFSQEPDMDRRRDAITKARHRGSVPPDVLRALQTAFDESSLYWHETAVIALEDWTDVLKLGLANGTGLALNQVLLATGFSPRRPGGSMIDSLVESASLPCASCGYPIVNESLMWAPGVYVSGPLAELELGPAARNIAGARRAGDRLIAMMKARQAAA